MKPLLWTLLLISIICLNGCGGLKMMIIGKKETKIQKDSSGIATSVIRIKYHTKSPIKHPHNTVIKKTKIVIYKNNKITESIFEKKRITQINWDGEILKYERKVWSESGKE